jgi:hypothetical protein
MKIQEFQGQTYTMIDEETFATEAGTKLYSWEIKEIRKELADCEKEMALWAIRMKAAAAENDEDGDETTITAPDAAANYTEALEKLTSAEESVELWSHLWDL